MSAKIANFQCIVDNPSQSNAVVLFHGYGADNSDLAPLAQFLDPEGKWTWIFPNAPLSVDIGMGFMGRAWFPIDQKILQESMMSGRPSEVVRDLTPEFVAVLKDLSLFIEQLKDTYQGIVLGGFSQGGMVASHLFPQAGESLCGALLLSTILVGPKEYRKQLESVSAKPFLQSHGSQDPVLSLKNARQLYDALRERGWSGEFLEFSGGHEIPMPVLQKAQQLLASLKCPPE